jgi:hypothetical protein
MTRETRMAWAFAFACACRGDGDQDEGASSSSTGEVPTTDDPSSGSSNDPDSSDDDGADSSEGDDDDGPSGDTLDPPDPPLPCPDEWNCKTDADGDEYPFQCDNAPDHTNPDQGDMDFDSFGDIVDLCPTVQQIANTQDSDKDGVGNSCDVCRLTLTHYNGAATFPPGYEIVNTPHQGDVDRDGVGDACDNCPLVPNCLEYGDGPGLTPWAPGMPIDPQDPTCNTDFDFDGIGDACEGMAGVGFGAGDDLDGDGIDNAADACPRVRADGSAHEDPDGDGVGSECDVCPFVSDAQQNDVDGDFVGDACEESTGCIERHNPRPIAFYDVAVGGYCCTTAYDGHALADPDGAPLSTDDLPVTTPGVLELPPGCSEALADAGVASATLLSAADVGGLDELWDHVCLLPVWDQDFDALPDNCDFCAFAFDPDNTPYVDPDGMEWPQYGAYCNGEYSCETR